MCVCSRLGSLAERRKKRRRSRKGEGAPGRHSGGERAAAGSEVGGGLGGERLDAAGVAVFAEDVSVQGVASLVVPLRQQRAAVLRDAHAVSVGVIANTGSTRVKGMQNVPVSH